MRTGSHLYFKENPRSCTLTHTGMEQALAMSRIDRSDAQLIQRPVALEHSKPLGASGPTQIHTVFN